MPVTIRRRSLGYGIAAAGAVLAGLSPWWLAPLLGDTPPVRLMLVAVVMISSWLGGLGPGLFAAGLGLLAIVAANDAVGDLATLATRLLRFGSLGLLIPLLFHGMHVSRRRAELKESLLRSFYESSAMAMGVIELTERRRADRLGQRADRPALRARAGQAVEGKTARELGLPPDRLAAWLERFRRVPGDRPAGPLRGRRPAWPHRPGVGRRHALGHGHPRASDGDLCSFLIEDITDRKRTEEDLRVAKELAEAASQPRTGSSPCSATSSAPR